MKNGGQAYEWRKNDGLVGPTRHNEHEDHCRACIVKHNAIVGKLNSEAPIESDKTFGVEGDIEMWEESMDADDVHQPLYQDGNMEGIEAHMEEGTFKANLGNHMDKDP